MAPQPSYVGAIDIKIINKSKYGLPAYQTSGAAGMDICANVDEPVTIAPGERVAIPTGLHISLPEGLELQIRPRSGNAIKYGITVCNTPGTIDCDFRGEIKIILINHGNQDFVVNGGDRVAQGVITNYIRGNWVEVDSLDETERGVGGFGHTGLKYTKE